MAFSKSRDLRKRRGRTPGSSFRFDGSHNGRKTPAPASARGTGSSGKRHKDDSMTIENRQTSVSYAIGGAGNDYPVPFPILAKDNLEVEKMDADGNVTPMSAGFDYTVHMTGDPAKPLRSATVELLRPVSGGWLLLVSRRVPITQENFFHAQGPNSPVAMEEGLDKLTMICQELSARLDAVPSDSLAAGQRELDERVAAIERRLESTMPTAPVDGETYAARGRAWTPIDAAAGDPFVRDAAGYAVPVRRAAYRPNSVWHVAPGYVSASASATAGDEDSLFTVDGDGYCVLK